MLFLTGSQLSKGALFRGTGNLIAAFQRFVDDHTAALRAHAGVVRPAADQWRIPECRVAAFGRVVAASVEHFAAARFLLDDLSFTLRSGANYTCRLQDRSLFFAFLNRASQVIAVPTVANQHGRPARLASFLAGTIFGNRQSITCQRNLGLALGITDAAEELAEP